MAARDWGKEQTKGGAAKASADLGKGQTGGSARALRETPADQREQRVTWGKRSEGKRRFRRSSRLVAGTD
jgi:hypothetical protein